MRVKNGPRCKVSQYEPARLLSGAKFPLLSRSDIAGGLSVFRYTRKSDNRMAYRYHRAS
jgi:hypothetical protein